MARKSYANIFAIMRKNILYIVVLILSLNTVFAQLNPEPKKVTKLFFPEDESIENVTPALQKKRGFTDYDELISFLKEQQDQHPELVTIDYIGKSQKGYDIPIIYIKNKSSSKDKIKVWFQGALHGNEMATTESLLYTMYKILNEDSLRYLLDKIELAIVPMANIDGYLKSDRYAANGLDLNRDQTKLMAPETLILKQSFSNYAPEVALDFHEYNPYRRDFAKMGSFGITSAFDAMFLYSSNLNVAENIRKLTDTLFVNNARSALDEHQFRHSDYMSTGDHFGEIHFNKGGSSARSSANSYALANSISSVIEVRGIRLGRTSFKRRIKITYVIALSFLKTAFEQVEVVKQTLKEAHLANQHIAVTTKRRVYEDTIKAIDLDSYKLIDLPVTFRDAKGATTILKREKPEAYLITKELGFLVEKLKILGLEVETLERDETLKVEAYTITEFNRDETKYEKMNLQTVTTELQTKQITFPKGSFKIATNQKNSALLYEVLEPERPNSFISFGVLETELHQELPIYRLSSTN